MNKLFTIIIIFILTGCYTTTIQPNTTYDQQVYNAVTTGYMTLNHTVDNQPIFNSILSGKREYQPIKFVYISDESMKLREMLGTTRELKYPAYPFIEVKAFFKPYLLKSGWTVGCVRMARDESKYFVGLFNNKEFQTMSILSEGAPIVQKCIQYKVR